MAVLDNRLHQSMEFLKGVDHPVDYGTELPTIKVL